MSSDLSTALGAFNVHSAIWVQATYTGSSGGFIGIGKDDNYDVQILHWCVQCYDVYDWNVTGIASTPFPMSVADAQKIKLPPDAYTVTPLGGGMVMVNLKDSYFRDLEVSGGGRAYLVRSESFEAPSSVTGSFGIKI